MESGKYAIYEISVKSYKKRFVFLVTLTLSLTCFSQPELLKVKIHTNIITNHHRVMENGCIWEGVSLMNICWVSQSAVFCQVLNAVQ